MGLLGSLIQLVQTILCGSGKPEHDQQQQPPGTAHQYPPAPYHFPAQQPPVQPPVHQHPIPVHHQPSKPSKPHHSRIDDNALAQANPHYQQLRAQARAEGDAMARAFEASKEAYKNRDGAKAKELSNEGKKHKAEMERLDKEASDWIFEQVNMDSAPNELDLHGLYVKEAIARTEAAVQAAQNRGDEEIHIIVGKGLHSQGHVAKLKPAIEDLMVKYQLNARIDPRNEGILIVQLGGRGQRGMSPNEVTRRLERDDEQCVVIYDNQPTNQPQPSEYLMWLLVSTFLLAAAALYLGLNAHATHIQQIGTARKRELIANRRGGSIVVGFFHPYCNSGGGGERVLWAAISYLQRTNSHVINVVYTGDTDATKEEIIAKVKTRFDIILDPSSLEFVFLQERWLVEDTTWPRFTLAGQSLGSMMLAYEAMRGLIPDLFIDTMGYAFTYHAVRWFSRGRTPVSAYVHYPTISTDMLERVKSRTSQFNNPNEVSRSAARTNAKLIYYRLFALAYSASLSLAEPIMVNSSWTKAHVDHLLNHAPVTKSNLSVSDKGPAIVYPPCDTQSMASLSLEGRKKIILSLAQFRPEKDHAKQIFALARLFEVYPEHKSDGVRLVLMGSSRNTADEERIKALQSLVTELNLEGSVEFIVNASYDVVLSWLAGASIGTNTMIDEHFGINVVEFMAAGLIPVVHASGGPLGDIVVPYEDQPTGYHATDAASFAEAFHQALSLPAPEALIMRQRARALAIERFSTDRFEKGWARGWELAVRGIRA
ncbi:Alpha-1,2-mannosyltransferase [Ceratobasidium theobromae]|uniref:GDP-Man:Man(3)GlcNAc(2)-PP-Dol alpha-1,2-mannosyltransferase n=1 Tax=Ceratobasidium theobromae TaxID=1582974 RepID=A0A5N5QTW1_9AGAM|nr:Alpha-1,2-mannosyltransferase [Ceratobasidium theobromae]